MQKRKCLVDMDGVLVDLLPTWLQIYGRLSNEYIHPDSITAYDYQSFINLQAEFAAALGPALVGAPPMAGSLAFTELCKVADVTITTYIHPSLETDEGKGIKTAWLARWFGKASYKLQFIGVDRGKIQADYLVDDSPENVKKFLKHNKKGAAFLIAHKYNEDFAAQNADQRIIYVDGLATALEFINDFEQEKATT